MSRSKKHTVLSTDRINEHLASWSKSNQTITDYCAAQNISKSTFYYWRRKSNQRAYLTKTAQDRPNCSFIEIAPPASQEKFCLHLPPYTLEIPHRFNPATLCDIVSVLQDEAVKSKHAC